MFPFLDVISALEGTLKDLFLACFSAAVLKKITIGYFHELASLN